MAESLAFSPEEEEVVAKACSGDRRAFEDLLQQYYPAITNYIHRRINDFHEGQDLVQETFLQVLCCLGQLRSNDHFPRWMFKIAFHVTVDWRRTRGKRNAQSVSIEAFSEEELEWATDDREEEERRIAKVDGNLAVARVVREVRALPDDYGVVLTLRYLEDLSCREIAAALGVTVTNVKVKLFRARRLLKRRLQPYAEELTEAVCP